MPPSPEQWKDIRTVLKEGILAGTIPMDPAAMRPKAVFNKFKDSPGFDCLLYSEKATREKFSRMLRGLRKKHADGDLEDEDKPKRIEWGKSAAKQFLKKAFRDGIISIELAEDPDLVWNTHCKNHAAFRRMSLDNAFKRRLKSVKDDFVLKCIRRDQDMVAYTAAKQNHPTPPLNRRGEPQWNGSEAQKLLKEMVRKGDDKNATPTSLWEKHEVFQVFNKKTFRDHIYQERRLVKFDNYVAMLAQQKIDELQY